MKGGAANMPKSETAKDGVQHSRVRERWQRIIAAMLTSRSDVEAAALAGISRSSLWRIKQDPEFTALYQAAKDAQLQSAIDSLRGNANAFVDVLVEVSGDTKQNGSARVRASEVGLNSLARFVEMEDILRRIAKIESQAGEGAR
jgi:hypothetical protein